MLTLKLAFRNLFRNTRRTLLTCLLIGCGLTALILSDSIIEGMNQLLVNSITKTLQGEMQVHHPKFLDTWDADYYLHNTEELVKEIESDPLVSALAVRTLSGGMISSSYNLGAGMIYGINPNQELKLSQISQAVIEGRYLTGNEDEILIGSELADLLEVSLDDRVVVTMAEIDSGELSQSLFRLSGIVHFGIRAMDSSFAFINLRKAQSILGLQDQSHEIAVRFHNPEDGQRSDLPLINRLSTEKSEALNWIQFDPAIGSMIEMSEYSTVIIGTVLFLLVSLGVINSMFMSIYERIYEFGVAKAIGTRATQLVKLILCEAFLLAIISCIFGLVLGGLLSYWASVEGVPLGDFEVSGIAINDKIVPINRAYQFIQFPIYVILLTIIAAIYPAVFAARISPAEALHKSL